jgi:hypothetical protein
VCWLSRQSASCTLFAFFIAFNPVEALLPSLVSCTAPPSRKGLVIGVYNRSQSIVVVAAFIRPPRKGEAH